MSITVNYFLANKSKFKTAKVDFPLKQTTPFRWKETTPKLTTL